MTTNIPVKTISLLEATLIKARKDDEILSIINCKDEVLRRYSQIFQYDNIDNLSMDDFLSFLNFKNNKHWSGLNRQSKNFKDNEDNLINALKLLTDESVALPIRFHDSIMKVKGMGPAIASAVLHVSDPERYGIFNDTSLEMLYGLNLLTSNNKNNIEIYEEINEILNRLKIELNIDLWTLDAVWYYLGTKEMKDKIYARLTTATDEILPDEHIILYDLFNQLISGYSGIPEESIDGNDFYAILYMLTTEKPIIKQEKIEKSNLSLEIKTSINQQMEEIYSNNNRTQLGVLRRQSLIANLSEDDQSKSARRIIKLCLKIAEINDKDSLFKLVEEETQEKIAGIGVPTFSYILHSMKPSVFPIILESKNYNKLMKYLNIKLLNKTDINTYIHNSLILQEFRDSNCKFKDYAVMSEFANKVDNIVDLFSVNEPSTSKSGSIQKNTILYGPPGTGKTYQTINLALEIIDGNVPKEFPDKMARYNELKNDGRIKFVTFHQSYGYEEFIEGIRPIMGNEEDEGDIRYAIQDGIFKQFCKQASVAMTLGTSQPDFKFNKNPVIWKFSLAGTKDNEIRRECLQNNHIRIGYDELGEDFEEITEVKRGRYVINRFVNDMRVGDIVLSCYSNTEVDAIGIITGDSEWNENYDKYKRLRKVDWIWRGKKDIMDLNDNKPMTLPTLYRLNRISVDDVLNIIGIDTSQKVPSDEKFVFIIDEINRGNISRIFGELITLIEPSKRVGAMESLKVELPYSRETFGVPDNVYILATMNTADRSLVKLDTALRRRFCFTEMKPRGELVPKSIGNIELRSVFNTINSRIEDLYDSDHCIGHSYFMNIKDQNELDFVFINNVIPLLQEYFHDDYGKILYVLSRNDDNEHSEFIRKKEMRSINGYRGTVNYEFTGEYSEDVYLSLYR